MPGGVECFLVVHARILDVGSWADGFVRTSLAHVSSLTLLLEPFVFCVEHNILTLVTSLARLDGAGSCLLLDTLEQ